MADNLKLEVGKTYRTRGGQKVCIDRVIPHVRLPFPFWGALTTKNGDTFPNPSFKVNGRYSGDEDISPYDLMEEWSEKIQLKVGGVYQTRDGQQVIITHLKTASPTYDTNGSVYAGNISDGGTWDWDEDGVFSGPASEREHREKEEGYTIVKMISEFGVCNTAQGYKQPKVIYKKARDEYPYGGWERIMVS